MLRRTALLGIAGLGLRGQSSSGPGFICPMDQDVKAASAGKCPRCGMKLVANLPEPLEYRLDLRVTPSAPRVGQPAELEFRVRHPKTGQPVREFEIMHERLFHAFLISADLAGFAHEHPSLRSDGAFALTVPDGAVSLRVRRLGYRPQTIAIPGDRSAVDIVLIKDVLQLDAVLTTAQQGTLDKKNAATATVQITAEDLNRVPAMTVEQACV